MVTVKTIPGQTPDAELFGRALEARDAFDALVHRYHAMVYSVAYAHLGQRETAEEVAQEVFLRAYLHLGGLKDPEKLGGWLAAIARNVTENWRVKGQTRSRLVAMVPIDELESEIVDRESASPRDRAAAKQEAAALHKAMEKLPGQHREIVLMHFLAGLSKSDIAQRLGLYPSSVGRRLEKALALLRRELSTTVPQAVQAAMPTPAARTRVTVIVALAATLPTTAKAALTTAAITAPVPATNLLSPLTAKLNSGGKASMFIKGAAIIGVLATIVTGGREVAMRSTDSSIVVAQAPPPRRPPADRNFDSERGAPPPPRREPAPAPPAAEASADQKFEILGVREMEHARVQSKLGRVGRSVWMHGGAWLENSWGRAAGDSVEWDIDLKDPISDLKMGLRYCYDQQDMLNGRRKFATPHILHLSIDNTPPVPLELADSGGWNHAAIHTLALPVLSPGNHTFKLSAPVDWSDVNLDCATFYRGETLKATPGPLRPMRLATSKGDLITVCVSPMAEIGEDPALVAATFAELREMMTADYGSGPQVPPPTNGTIFVHFADPKNWEFPPAEMGWHPSPGERRGRNSNALRQSGRVVKNRWGIYMRADGEPYDRAEWCWAMAEYFGSRDVPDWFRHSSARVSGLLDWLPALDKSTTESEDIAGAQLVADARAFLASEEKTQRVEIVHAAVRSKYGNDVYRKFWKLVNSRGPQQAGPLDKIAVLAFLSQAAGGDDVTPLYRRWEGFATEGPVDPLVIGDVKERPEQPSAP